jgi:hypothetical protein
MAMMSLDTIHYLNMEIAVESAAEGLVPYVPFDADEVDSWPPIPFPSLGNFLPDGWENTDQHWFVDKTGYGGGDEPALNCDQFKRQLRGYILRHPGDGFAITEEGECQAVVTAFKKVRG